MIKKNSPPPNPAGIGFYIVSLFSFSFIHFSSTRQISQRRKTASQQRQKIYRLRQKKSQTMTATLSMKKQKIQPNICRKFPSPTAYSIKIAWQERKISPKPPVKRGVFFFYNSLNKLVLFIYYVATTDPVGAWPRWKRVRLGRRRRTDSLEISYAGAGK